jgi:alpha-N-arabinofuranosidase
MKSPRPLTSLLVLFTANLAFAGSITVDVAHPGPAINPAMWGAFFEDINFGADGGIYAEMIKNRGFEFPEPLMGWTKLNPALARGEIAVRTDDPFNAKNAHYVRIQSAGKAPLGLANSGFRGIGVQTGKAYDFSVRVRRIDGAAKLSVRLYGGDGALLETVELTGFTGEWGKYTATLKPKDTDPKAWIAVLLDGVGTLDLDFASLFPHDTWKGRAGGLRADMVQALADLKPGFFRFPGGCIVEGGDLAKRYQWKQTLGPVEERPLLINRWNYEFLHRPTPDYYQSFGLGFFEYFQLCEDIGASPLPIINCGMACQFNSGELCKLEELGPYIQDALDLVEFANGPVTSAWGAKRAALGHPAPFKLKMLGIGNEQWGQQYIDRYQKFAEVLKAKYPEIMLVSAAGPSPEDDRFKFLWPKLRELKADIVDEHSYAKPAWFLDNAHRYDEYDRNGPKVFMGEYAAQSVGVVNVKNRNTFECALAEAAFLTGLERNADVVRMASYAPLFAHIDAWQWTPNLLWTDNQQVVRTANYHVQALFAHNRGDRILPVKLDGLSAAETTRLYASATLDEKTHEVILKLVNATANESRPTIDLGGAKLAATGTLTVLQAEATAENTFAAAERVTPQTKPFAAGGSKFGLNLPANSMTVLRIGVSQ